LKYSESRPVFQPGKHAWRRFNPESGRGPRVVSKAGAAFGFTGERAWRSNRRQSRWRGI